MGVIHRWSTHLKVLKCCWQQASVCLVRSVGESLHLRVGSARVRALGVSYVFNVKVWPSSSLDMQHFFFHVTVWSTSICLIRFVLRHCCGDVDNTGRELKERALRNRPPGYNSETVNPFHAEFLKWNNQPSIFGTIHYHFQGYQDENL